MYYCTNTGCIFRDYKGCCVYGCACACGTAKPTPKQKPPLGVMPRDTWDQKRQEELAAAMASYLEAGKRIPKEWLEEYNEISGRWEEVKE